MPLFDLITTALATVISPVVNYVASAVSYISSNYQSIISSITNYFKSEIDSVKSDLNTSVGGIKNSLEIGLEGIRQDYSQSTEAIGAYLNQGLAGVISSVTDVGFSVINYTGEKVDEVKGLVSDTYELIAKEIKDGMVFLGALVAEIPLTLERLTRAGFEALATLPELFGTFEKRLIKKLDNMLDIDDEKLKAAIKRGFELGEEISKEQRK